jgi:4-amino-4-deoxy-L-arabinose transferase-like glycosyltransferase
MADPAESTAVDGTAWAVPASPVTGPAQSPAGTDAPGPAPGPTTTGTGPTTTGTPRQVPLDAPPDPRWARPALLALLAATGLGWAWDLGRNGWGNTFYAAAVQAGTQSWKAFFFGSFDAESFITVDKPPVSLWVMALSGRVFGFSSWSMLAPQVLLGVGAVALLYGAVRRVWGAPAGLLAAAGLAATPVAALMFRFNNPDAALTFLLVAAAWAMTRALADGRRRWLLACAVLLGAAFATKSLQALLVVPGLALAYLVAAPGGVGRRVGRLLAAGGVLAVSGLWWFVVVDAIPASQRPHAGGSTTNSTLDLALGSNGLGRISGAGGGAGRPGPGPGVGAGQGPGIGPGIGAPGGAGIGAPGGPGGGPGGDGSFGGLAGLGRMVNPSFGGEIAWLLPTALVALALGLWLTRRAPRTDPRRASLVLWGGWLLVTSLVLSFMSGIVHTYYAVALAPAVAALAGMLLPALWRARGVLVARVALATLVAVSAGTTFGLLGRADGWLPWLRWAVAGSAVVAVVGLLAVRASGTAGRRVGAAVAGLGLAAGLAAPLAWSVATVATTHTGSLPTSGPATTVAADAPDGADGRGADGRGADGLRGGGRGGPGTAQQVDPAVVALLQQDAARYTWAAAAPSSMSAGPLQLESGLPVMSLGGFNGSDPAITLQGFTDLVAAGRVHYYVAEGDRPDGGRGRGGGPGESGASGQIGQWVAQTFTARGVGDATVYDLSRPASPAGS